MSKKTLLPLVGCLLIAAIAFGDLKTITLKDGRKYTGEISRTRDGFTIKIGQISFGVDANEVVSIVDVMTPELMYRKKLKEIDPNSANDHLLLGQWAIKQNSLEIARDELDAALRIDPNLEKASLLKGLVDDWIRQAVREKDIRPGGPSSLGAIPVRPEWLVTKEDIYRIRVEELRPDDTVVIEFRNKVLDRFMKTMQGREGWEQPQGEKAFRRFRRAQKVNYILSKIDRDNSAIKDDIIIRSDPKFMQEFRKRVWPVVSKSCATMSCHGGIDHGAKFKLFNFPGRNERIEYTNFLLLDMVEQDGLKMIDRDRPENSMLLQYGLPRNLARYPHPGQVTPAYRSPSDASYRRVMAWIRSLKGPIHPSYRVKYKPPAHMRSTGDKDKDDLNQEPSVEPAASQPVEND